MTRWGYFLHLIDRSCGSVSGYPRSFIRTAQEPKLESRDNGEQKGESGKPFSIERYRLFWASMWSAFCSLILNLYKVANTSVGGENNESKKYESQGGPDKGSPIAMRQPIPEAIQSAPALLNAIQPYPVHFQGC